MLERIDLPVNALAGAFSNRISRRDTLRGASLLGLSAAVASPRSVNAQDASGGILTIGSTQEPDSLNPFLSGLLVSWEVEELIFCNLTKVASDNTFVPCLALDVPSLDNGGISADGLTYTYRLRNDVTWHDGQPFTARDVTFTWETIMDPDVEVRSRSGFDRIESIETPDDYTVVFHLTGPYAPFLETWSYKGILPRHLLEGQDINQSDFNRSPVGTGPYMFKEWITGSYIEVVRNPQYFAGPTLLEGIIYKIVPSSDVLLAQIEAGEIDLAFRLSTEQAVQAQEFEGWQLYDTVAPAFFHVVLNNANPLFADVNVRRAISHAIDKNAIIQGLLYGMVDEAWSPITPFSWAHYPDVPTYPYDPVQAAALLDGAGWVLGSDGIREKDGQQLTFTILNIAGEQERLDVVQAVQQQWRDVGIGVEIAQVDAATFVATAVTNREHEAAYAFWAYGADPDPSFFYLSDAPYNYANYSNAEVDRLMVEALATVDPEARKALYQQIQVQIATDIPTILIFYRKYFDVAQSHVLNFMPNPTTQTNMWNAVQWQRAN